MFKCNKCFHQYCISNDSLASCNVCEDGDMFSPIKESEDKKMARCPYCNAEIEFDEAFADFEDNGDFIVATGPYYCECGETLTVRAFFQWDGNLEVS